MAKKNSLLNMLGTVSFLVTAGGAAYWFLVRPWHRAWGTTPDETTRRLPGDDLLPNAAYSATHAITIDASVEQVWPWLVQIGAGRAGFYSYDEIENAMNLDIHSSNRIVPELQALKVGDTLPLAPDGFGPKVAILEREKALVLHGDSRSGEGVAIPGLKPGEYLAVMWGFYLEPIDERHTRLIERFHLDYPLTNKNQFYYRVFLEPGSFVMERKMLLGIKARAERSEPAELGAHDELTASE
jgi:hypothetical protein